MKPQTLVRGVGVAVIVSLAWPAIATAQRLTPLPHAMPGGPRPAAVAQLKAASAPAVTLGTEEVYGSEMIYCLEKKDWTNFGKYYLRYFDTAVTRSEYPINNISYALFEHVTDPAVLEATIKAQRYSMETLAKDDRTEIDTYANLLYKAGRNREAIEWQEKAVRLTEGRDKEITDHLDRMRAGQATWPGG